jgi:ABC-2 type transport system permease protein
MPYDIAAGVMMGTLILMSLFYSADALHDERRDRSILFWKSLPVSDLTTVLAKASIPLLVLPLLAFAVTVVMQLIMLLVSSVVLLANGISVAPLWRELGVVPMWGRLIYHLLTAHAIWPFPVFCWVMLVSGWARRATLLWAALPVVVIGGIEKLFFNTTRFLNLVGTRLIGAGAQIDITPPNTIPLGPMAHLTPGRFLGAPSLWIGLALAVVFLAAAVRLRRYQGPI